MWAELSETRLIPSLAQTRHKHTNKLPRDHSALGSRCWLAPAPGQPRGHVLPGERGHKHQGNTGRHPVPRWHRPSRTGRRHAGPEPLGRSPGVPEGDEQRRATVLGTGGAREEPPPLSTGTERRGCLSSSLSFLFSNKSQTRAQPAAATAPPPGGRAPAGPPAPGAARRRPGRARSAGEGCYSRILTLRWSRRARSSSRAPRRRWSRALRWHRESASLRIPPKMSPAQRERSESCISSDTSAYELTCSSVPKSGTAPRRRPPPPSAAPEGSPGAGPPRSAPSPPASSNLHSFSGSRVRRGNGIAAGDGGQRGHGSSWGGGES